MGEIPSHSLEEPVAGMNGNPRIVTVDQFALDITLSQTRKTLRGSTGPRNRFVRSDASGKPVAF